MHFFFKTLVQWRGFLIKSALIAAAAMAGISFLLPKWYTAKTSVFPPETNTGVPMYAEVLQSLSLPIMGPMASGIAPETIYIDMLRSRRIAERLIAEFRFHERYHNDRIEEVIKAFHSHTGFTLLENGLLIVTFEDRNPDDAAKILNRMIELLDDLNRELNVTRASRTRAFIEEQLVEREKMLAEAEDALNAFQEENRALDLDQQLQVTLDIVSSLTARAISLETELKILGYYASKTSEEYLRLEREYQEVVKALGQLKVHEDDSDDDMLRSFIPSLDDVPLLALEMVRLKRKVEIESTVYTMLVQEYEKARFEEARDMSTLQVLDPAQPPSLRSRPRRKLLVLLGMMVGLAWGAMIALVVSTWRENRERSAVIQDVLGPLVSDFRRILRRR